MPKAIKATDIKYKPTGVLADIIGTRQRKRGQIVKAIWKHIKDEGLQGESGSGDSVKYKGKNYVGGQIIYCGECPMMKKLCKNKNKIAMVQLSVYMEPYLERMN